MGGKFVSCARDRKTRKAVDIEVTGERGKLVSECPAIMVVRQTFVCRKDGERNTFDGISAMFRRGRYGLRDFGLYDLKGEAATDMFRAGKGRAVRP